MNDQHKKELLTEYKHRHPEMGVIAYRCIPTGESFLEISRDTSIAFNRHTFQLKTGHGHPNKSLQKLWNTYGESQFELLVLKKLDYKNREDVTQEDLEALRDKCLLEDKKAQKLWR